MVAPFEGPLFKSTFSFFIYIKKADFCPPSSPMRVLIPRLFPCPAWTLSLRASNPLKFAPAKKKIPWTSGAWFFLFGCPQDLESFHQRADLTARARSGAGGCGAELLGPSWTWQHRGRWSCARLLPVGPSVGEAEPKCSGVNAAFVGEIFFPGEKGETEPLFSPPACPPRGLFNSVGFRGVRAGTQKPCPVPWGRVYPLLEAALWVRVPPVCCWSSTWSRGHPTSVSDTL